jgi:hypothetical protein
MSAEAVAFKPQEDTNRERVGERKLYQVPALEPRRPLGTIFGEAVDQVIDRQRQFLSNTGKTALHEVEMERIERSIIEHGELSVDQQGQAQKKILEDKLFVTDQALDQIAAERIERFSRPDYPEAA